MIARLFAPKTPAEEWAAERERVAKAKPHLVLVDPRPQPDMFRWVAVADLIPIKGDGI